MNYPQEIIPQPNYAYPFPLDELTKIYSSYYVCFRIDGPLDEYTEKGLFNGQRKLMRKCFLHMPHLSMNIYGGGFKPEYVKYVQKRPGSEQWDGKSMINVDDFLSCISEKAEVTPVFYKSEVICQSVNTLISFTNKNAYKAMRSLFQDLSFPDYIEGIEVLIPTDIKMKHVPTNLNYWHVQMEVYPPTADKELRNDSVDWRRLIFENIRDSILRLYYEKKPSFDYSIPEYLYVDNDQPDY